MLPELQAPALKPSSRVLIVEDLLQTVDGWEAMLEAEDFPASVAPDISTAALWLSTHSFDLLLVDWALPRKLGDEVLSDGGLLLLRDLWDGHLGSRNVLTPFAVITSPARVSPEAEEALAEKTGTYRGIMFKMGDARPVLRLVEAVRQRPHRRPPTQEFHTVVRLHTVLRDRGLLQVVVPGWRPNEIVEVPWSVMSDSALRALEHDSVVRYFTATARLSASNAQELNLCNLEVSDVAPGVVDE